MSDPPAANSQVAERPSTSAGKRPRTGVRRPSSRRPDTTASAIGELPEQQFFPEGDDDEEDYEDEEEELEEEVFAFHRPATAAVAGGGFSDYSGSAPTTGMGGPVTPGSFGSAGAEVTDTSKSPIFNNRSSVPTPTGAIDVGGHLPELEYDKSNPPPFSGRANPNNSSFAFTVSSLGESSRTGGTGKQRRPPSGASLFERIQRRRMNTATTAMTTTTELTTATSRTSDDSEHSQAGSFSDGRPRQNRRMRSSAPLISDGESMSEAGMSRRGHSRGSFGMTELTGDITVPDGHTTWGDGGGHVFKGDSEGNGSIAPADFDMIEEDSPYPEVRASVSNIDDPEMPALTIRAWVLGMFFCILASACNTFFVFRNPAPVISPLIIQVVVYPIGKFFAWVLPIDTYRFPRWLGGVEFSLNPGPFNIKEHALVSIMANPAVSPAYAMYATVSSQLFYQRDFGYGFQILFVLATQLTGFSFAGLCRRFVVWPASMIWPSNLVTTTNLNAFHAEEDGFTGGMSRFRFLIIGLICATAWYFVPGFLFTALSYFSYACWIAPNNRVVNELFGVSTGLGMGILTFDWAQISYFVSPLTVPWWAQANIGGAFILFYWIIVPALYYSNVWQTAYLPISVSQAADRFGGEYDVSYIINPDLTLNKTAYALYSPVYLSASFSMTFMIAFALATGLIVHTALYHGPRIYRAIINVKSEPDDIHMKLMRQYPEVPDWWFLAILIVTFVLSIVAIEVFHTAFPVWGYIVSVLLAFVYTIPAVFIYAMTSTIVTINLIAELIPGYLFQGQPIPGMIFKVFSIQAVSEALFFVQDMKLGHYMKIPPRATFIAQLSSVSICCFVQTGVKEWIFHTIPDICSSTQKSLLTCARTKVFYTSSIIWGLIGPQRLFSHGALYNPQLYAFLVGAIVPVILWVYVRKYPKSKMRNVNLPVMFNGVLNIPPATGINYSSWLVVGFVFQFWIRRKRFAWWSKYNYILSSALDVGTALGAIAIFLLLDLPGASLNWWGTTVYKNTADWSTGAALRDTPEAGFGPTTWKVD